MDIAMNDNDKEVRANNHSPQRPQRSELPELISVETARGTMHLTPEQAKARGITVPEKKDSGRKDRPAPITHSKGESKGSKGE